MITDLKGTRFLIRGAFYTIGDKIIVEDGPYNGMYGVIAEIRTETDSALGADTPEIYCELYPPFGSEGLSAVKKRRSKKSQAQTIMENISTVRVRIPIDNIRNLVPSNSAYSVTGYRVQEDWAINGSCDGAITIFLDFDMAQHFFFESIYHEQRKGCIKEWKSNPRYQEQVDQDSFECWIEDDYCENHYKITVEHFETEMGDPEFERIGCNYIRLKLRSDFATQIEDWEEISDLTEMQIYNLVNGMLVPSRIAEHMKSSSSLEDAYWEALSEVAFDLVRKFRKGQGLPPIPKTGDD